MTKNNKINPEANEVEIDYTSAELIGMIAVDSGQVMIGDPCYLRDWELWNSETEPFDNTENREGEYGYLGACATTTQNLYGGLGLGRAIVTRSGLGDGVYNVYGVLDTDKNVAQVIIDFTQEQVLRDVVPNPYEGINDVE